MSMWEIEALMENTVRLFDKSESTSSEKRNLIWNTYNLQNQFDCSFTQFRLIEILIKNQYVQQYGIDEFPITKEYPLFFNELLNKEFEWILKNPTEKWSDENLEIAYWEKKSNRIYVDFGSKYYSINPTEVAVEIEPLDFGMMVIEESYKQNDKSNIYDWTAFFIVYILEWFPPVQTIEKLKEMYFQRIKTIFKKFDFSDYKVLHEGLNLNNLEGSEYLSDTQRGLIKFITK